MSWLTDTFLGARSDPSMPGWSGEFIDDIQAAGDTGLGRAGRDAKKDLRLMRDGRIEDVGRLRGSLSAINANKASSYTTADRMLRSNYAMEGTPGALTSAMLGEVAGQLDQNAGVQFANAAAGAYGDAEDTLDRNRMHRDQQKLQAAQAAAAAAQGFTFDRSRHGGLLQDLMKEWLSPKGVAGGKEIFS